MLGFRIEPYRVEGDKFAVEFRLVFGPQGPHGQHAFPQYLEAARVLGVRALKEGGTSTDERLQFLGRTVLAHPYDAALLARLRLAHDTFAAQYAKNETGAKELLKVGEQPADAQLPVTEQAVWMMMASSIMNSDEAINK